MKFSTRKQRRELIAELQALALSGVTDDPRAIIQHPAGFACPTCKTITLVDLALDSEWTIECNEGHTFVVAPRKPKWVERQWKALAEWWKGLFRV